MTTPRPGSREAQALEWLIKKRGYFYRADKAGYTAKVDEAGLYTEADAKAEARIEPEIMSAHHISEFPTLRAALAPPADGAGEVEAWSTCISGAIWAEIRSGLTGRFEEQFTLHQRADRYEMSSAHLDECARILTHRIEGKLWPATNKDTQDE